MRAVTVIGVLLAAGAGTLRAQHAHQLAIGGFGSYSHYDKQFQLDNQFGGGGRLAFYFNDYLGLEVDGNVAYPFPKSGGRHTQVRYGSASLVINGGGRTTFSMCWRAIPASTWASIHPTTLPCTRRTVGWATGSSSPTAWRSGSRRAPTMPRRAAV